MPRPSSGSPVASRGAREREGRDGRDRDRGDAGRRLRRLGRDLSMAGALRCVGCVCRALRAGKRSPGLHRGMSGNRARTGRVLAVRGAAIRGVCRRHARARDRERERLWIDARRARELDCSRDDRRVSRIERRGPRPRAPGCRRGDRARRLGGRALVGTHGRAVAQAGGFPAGNSCSRCHACAWRRSCASSMVRLNADMMLS